MTQEKCQELAKQAYGEIVGFDNYDPTEEEILNYLQSGARQGKLYSFAWYLKWRQDDHNKSLGSEQPASNSLEESFNKAVDRMEFKFHTGGQNREHIFLKAVFAKDTTIKQPAQIEDVVDDSEYEEEVA